MMNTHYLLGMSFAIVSVLSTRVEVFEQMQSTVHSKQWLLILPVAVRVRPQVQNRHRLLLQSLGTRPIW